MIQANLRIGLDFKPIVAEMTFASKRVYRGGIVVAYLLLLCIVSHTHADVIVASSTGNASQGEETTTEAMEHAPPDVERQLEASNENALVEFTCPVAESMCSYVESMRLRGLDCAGLGAPLYLFRLPLDGSQSGG